MDWLLYLRRAVSPAVTAEEEVVVFAVEYLYDMMNIVTQTDRRSVVRLNLFVTQTPPDVYLPCLFQLYKFCRPATSADTATVSVCASHSR